MATAAAPSLETTVYTSSSTHDALGRVLTAIFPDGSEVAYAYNQRGALKTVDCKHRGSLTSTPVVANIDYDVRGRRESITHAANATTTTYSYDPLNFRLRSIETTRASDSKKLQGLHYHYDPVPLCRQRHRHPRRRAGPRRALRPRAIMLWNCRMNA